MLKLAEKSHHADKSSSDTTQEAYTAALKLLLSQGHAVQYEHVAQASLVLEWTIGLVVMNATETGRGTGLHVRHCQCVCTPACVQAILACNMPVHSKEIARR